MLATHSDLTESGRVHPDGVCNGWFTAPQEYREWRSEGPSLEISGPQCYSGGQGRVDLLESFSWLQRLRISLLTTADDEVLDAMGACRRSLLKQAFLAFRLLPV